MLKLRDASEKHKSVEKPIFEELGFIRLGENWQESNRDYVLVGDAACDQRIFRRYQLKWSLFVTLDFWYRGTPISNQTAKRFSQLAESTGPVEMQQLRFLGELLGVAWQDGCLDAIATAEIGKVKDKLVLAVNWQQNSSRRRFLSLYIDSKGDGKTIREIHYSAPLDSFEDNFNFAAEAFRSIQWTSFAPPPLATAG